MKIALVIGSLRKDSVNRKVAEYLRSVAPDGTVFEEVRLDDLPLYNPDQDETEIAAYTRVRTQIQNADAVLIVSPEYNRSVPAAVKNLLDVASRPAGKSVWGGKKAAVVTASPGSYGGLSSGLQLRQILQTLGVTVLVNPEVYLSHAYDALDEQGKLSNKRTLAFLKTFMDGFAAWLSK